MNYPMALSVATMARSTTNNYIDDEHLEAQVLLCKGQKIMLMKNIWT